MTEHLRKEIEALRTRIEELERERDEWERVAAAEQRAEEHREGANRAAAQLTMEAQHRKAAEQRAEGAERRRRLADETAERVEHRLCGETNAHSETRAQRDHWEKTCHEASAEVAAQTNRADHLAEALRWIRDVVDPDGVRTDDVLATIDNALSTTPPEPERDEPLKLGAEVVCNVCGRATLIPVGCGCVCGFCRDRETSDLTIYSPPDGLDPSTPTGGAGWKQEC